MDFESLIDSITPEIYDKLRRAIELGKWPDGRALTREQKEQSMQAVIAYDLKHHNEAERVGYVDKGHKAGEVCDDPSAEQALNWKD